MGKKTGAAGRWQHRYLSEYKKDEKGNYVYHGAFYDLQKEEMGKLRHPFRKTALLLSAGTVMTLAAGMIPAPGKNTPLVFLPEGGAFISALVCLWKLFDLMSEKLPVKDYIYERTALPFPALCAVYLTFSVLSFAAEAVFLLFGGTDGAVGPSRLVLAALYLLFTAVSFFCVFSARRNFRGLKWFKFTKKSSVNIHAP